jgi:hypothetical protein
VEIVSYLADQETLLVLKAGLHAGTVNVKVLDGGLQQEEKSKSQNEGQCQLTKKGFH